MAEQSRDRMEEILVSLKNERGCSKQICDGDCIGGCIILRGYIAQIDAYYKEEYKGYMKLFDGQIIPTILY